MGKKWLVVILVGLLVGLAIGGAYGWWRLKEANYPYLFEAARYRLAPKWYLAEFQPIFLRQYTDKGARYFDVLYRNRRGKLTIGQVLVGGKYQDKELTWVLHDKKESTNSAGYETAGYQYPFSPGQRIRVTYLTAQEKADVIELKEICAKTARLCQLAGLVTGRNKYSEANVEGGLEPYMPVMAVLASGEPIEALPVKGAQP